MTEAQAVEAMLELWNAGWTAKHPSDAPSTFDNEAFTAPAIGAWVRVTIVHTVRRQASMGPKGARRFMSQGRIGIQIFVPSNKGTALAATLADDVRAILEETETDVGGLPLNIFDGSTTGNSTDGRWLMRVVVFPFTYWSAG